jgi:hypothetical protein
VAGRAHGHISGAGRGSGIRHGQTQLLHKRFVPDPQGSAYPSDGAVRPRPNAQRADWNSLYTSGTMINCLSDTIYNPQWARNGLCSGMGCCQAVVPPALGSTSSFGVGFSRYEGNRWFDTDPCVYGTVVEWRLHGTSSPRKTCTAMSCPGNSPGASRSPSGMVLAPRQENHRRRTMLAAVATAHVPAQQMKKDMSASVGSTTMATLTSRMDAKVT